MLFVASPFGSRIARLLGRAEPAVGEAEALRVAQELLEAARGAEEEVRDGVRGALHAFRGLAHRQSLDAHEVDHAAVIRRQAVERGLEAVEALLAPHEAA